MKNSIHNIRFIDGKQRTRIVSEDGSVISDKFTESDGTESKQKYEEYEQQRSIQKNEEYMLSEDGKLIEKSVFLLENKNV